MIQVSYWPFPVTFDGVVKLLFCDECIK